MYNGGKNGCGAYQHIINLIPPHIKYVELFLGSGAIMRKKLPAKYNVGVDLCKSVIDDFDYGVLEVDFYNQSAFEFLNQNNCSIDTFVYADPPYLFSTRKSQQKLYDYELREDEHIELLAKLKKLDCMVMISGYSSELYNDMLTNWNVSTFNQVDRSGETRIEYLWMNYEAPKELHDYQYLGQNFIQRQCIKRKVARWKNRLKELPVLERHAIINGLDLA